MSCTEQYTVGDVPRVDHHQASLVDLEARRDGKRRAPHLSGTASSTSRVGQGGHQKFYCCERMRYCTHRTRPCPHKLAPSEVARRQVAESKSHETCPRHPSGHESWRDSLYIAFVSTVDLLLLALLSVHTVMKHRCLAPLTETDRRLTYLTYPHFITFIAVPYVP